MTDILNSNNVMKTSWKLINKELGKDHKNHGIQSINSNGRSTTNHQIIADVFNKHFTNIPNISNQNINPNYCLTKTSVNNQNKLSYSLKHVPQNSFPSVKINCTTTKETENIIVSFKSSNSFGYDEVPTKIQGGSNMTGTDVARFTYKQSWSYLNHLVLNLCSHFFTLSLPPPYIQ